MHNEMANFLHAHPPFNMILPEEVQQVVGEIATEKVGPGQDILTQGGEPAEHLYIIRHGSVDLLREDDEGRVLSFDTLGEGDIFGLLSVIRGKRPEATVRSREEARLYLLPAATLNQLRCRNLKFSQFIDKVTFNHLLMINRMGDETGGTAPEYHARLCDVLQRKLVMVEPSVSVRNAAILMKQNNVRYIIVNTDPIGIVTDHDLRNRVMIEGRSYDTEVGQVMTSPITTLPADSLIFEGLMLMLEHRIRHLPVTEDGQVIGVVTHIDILRQQSHNPLFLPRQLMRARHIEDYRRYTEQVTRTVGSMLDADARVYDIGRVVAVAHGALLEHLIRNAEEEFGPPPCPYAWMVLGSEGRYEQTLRTDQDNALVYADNAPSDADVYFSRLAERIVEQLVACGFPRCPGDIMATNSRWRQPLHVWKHYFNDWIHLPDMEALMRASIFFDYRRVYGTLDVEKELRPILHEGGKNRIFLARMAKNALRQTPPLGGFLRSFAVEHNEEGNEVIDLKMRGTALIVDLARLFALEAGSPETNTFTRLHLAAPRSDLSASGARELSAAFEHISLLRLRHQYSQIQRGEQPDNLLPIAPLSKLERRKLKESLRAVEGIQRSVASLFSTSLISS
jgi:CBS domain-containing protein